MPFIGVFSTAAGEISDNFKTKMVEGYGKVLEDQDGIKRLFSDNLFKICQSSLESNALNSELVFKFSLRLYRLRKQFPSPAQEDDFVGQLKQIEETLKSEKKVASLHQATEIITEGFISEFILKFTKLETQIKHLANRENKIKEQICFGELEEDMFLKGSKDIFDQMHQVLLELEETENFIELFRFPEERREEWLAKALKYNPEKTEEIINITDSNPKAKRYLKGIIKILKTFVPFGEQAVETGDNILSIISDIWEGKSASEIFKRMLGITEDFTFNKLFTAVGKSLLHGMSSLVGPIKSVIGSIKTIIQARSNLRATQIETSLAEVRNKMIGMNAIHIKSMQSIQSSDNSIWIYAMLAKLNLLGAKIKQKAASIYHDEQLKALCRQNLYACGQELGFDYIRHYFLKEKVCPNDIFLAERRDLPILRDSKFILIKKQFTENYDLYLNYFFSFSKTLILQSYFSEARSEERMKTNVIQSIESFGYSGEGECADLESQVSVRKLKHKGNSIDLVVINKEFAYECNVIKYTTCRNMNHFFKLTEVRDNLKRAESLRIEPQDEPIKLLKRTNSNKNNFEVSSDISDLGTIEGSQKPQEKEYENIFARNENNEIPINKEYRNIFGARQNSKMKKMIVHHTKEHDSRPTLMRKKSFYEPEKKLFDSEYEREKRMERLTKIENRAEKLTKQDLDYNYPQYAKNIQHLLMKKVCETAKKPFDAFSEKEKTQMETIFKQQLKKFEILLDEEEKVYILKGAIEDFLEIQKIPSAEIKINFLDSFLILYNLVLIEYDSTLFELSENEGKMEVELFFKYERNPADYNILNYYSSGSKYCVHHKLIKEIGETTAYREYSQILKHNEIENVTQIEKNNPETINYFTDLESRISTHKKIFKVTKNDEDVYECSISLFLNEDAFIHDKANKRLELNDMHADYDSCHFTYQFAFSKIEDGENKGYSFKFMEKTDKLGLPLLKIKKAKEGELAFEHKFYILVYSDSDDISDENVEKRNSLYSTISKKLAHFGYYAVPNQGKENKVSVNHTRFWIDFNQGNLRIEVFVKPFKEARHEENKTICERIGLD